MRSSDPLFEETQYFRQVWLWVMLIPVLLFAAVAPWVTRKPAEPVYTMVLTSLIPALVILWFYILHLHTKITDEGIFYRFYPMQFRFRMVGWDEIERLEVIQYHPLRDFGGWGFRYGFKGRALNVSGNMGLMIYKKNGKRLLLGTKRPDDLKPVVEKIRLK